MSTTEPGITAFVRYLTLGEDRRDNNPKLRERIPNAPRVEFREHEREFYSYGRHFPLARFIPAKRGRSALWLVNGDRWGGGGWSLTNRHQEETRGAINQVIEDAAKTGKTIQTLIIPFSALDGAGLERDSIRPVHVRADRNETFVNTAKVPRRLVDVALPNREDVEVKYDAIQETQTLSTAIPLAVSRVSNDSGLADLYSLTAKITRAVVFRGYDHSIIVRHECGVCHGTGRVQTPLYDPRVDANVSEDSPCPVPNCQDGQSIKSHGASRDYDPPKVTLYVSGVTAKIVETNEDTVTLEWSTNRHWLGDSLFTAARVSRCGRCRGTGIIPAEDDSPVSPACPSCRGNGRVTKRGKFLSSFDYNERAPLYFLAALPSSSRAKTVDMAFEDLCPPAVHAAYARGLAVKRQGDIFLVPTPLTDADVYGRAVTRARLATWQRNGTPRKGEVSYNTPLSPAAELARTKLRRATWRATMADYLNGVQSRPETPRGFRAKKRFDLARLSETIARHESRIAAGDNVCGYDCGAYRIGSQTGDICGACNRQKWYDTYTAERASESLNRDRQRYAALLAMPRYTSRDERYAAKVSAVWNGADEGYLTDGNRARAAYWRAVGVADERYRPLVDGSAIRAALCVHGTGHTATEVVVCKSGVTYVRGRMSHVPEVAGERRDSDHAAVALNDARWYLAIRNTVPRQ